ncbi:MAG: hypothetical protein ACREX8_19470, partial [Gammaproteobacteria bacterium]
MRDASAQRHVTRAVGAALTCMTLVLTATAIGACGAEDDVPAQQEPNSLATKLTQDVTVDGVHRHLRALQRIADVNGGIRAAA